MSEFIGPALPPGFQKQDGDSLESSNTRSNAYGPSLPTSVVVGQTNPPCSSPDAERLEIQTHGETSSYGPSLPPELTESDEHSLKAVVGPSLPPGYGGHKENEEALYTAGPALPPGFGSYQEDDSNMIGPLPSHGEADDHSKRIRDQFESRSKAMKDKLTGKDKQEERRPQREDWMLELPAEFKPSGVGARKFRTGVIESGDRSVWTDTPADRLRKAKEEKAAKKEPEVIQRSARDQKLESFVNDYNKKNRPESLMSMHRKRRAEELKESSSGARERKPFNRETDLEIRSSLVTPAKRKALMKDSKQSLESKFTHGSSSFL